MYTSWAFRNLARPDEQFGSVRLWGTVGWMVTGWLIGYWLACPGWLCDVLSWLRPRLAPVAALLGGSR